jgi:HEAT repeat protein
MASDATLPAVQELFQHADEKVRRWALVTTGYLNNPAAVAPLIERLQNGQGLDCHSAAFALHRIGDPNGWAEVRRFSTAHADPDVRAWLVKFTQNPAMRGQDVLLKLTRGY